MSEPEQNGAVDRAVRAVQAVRAVESATEGGSQPPTRRQAHAPLLRFAVAGGAAAYAGGLAYGLSEGTASVEPAAFGTPLGPEQGGGADPGDEQGGAGTTGPDSGTSTTTGPGGGHVSVDQHVGGVGLTPDHVSGSVGHGADGSVVATTASTWHGDGSQGVAGRDGGRGQSESGHPGGGHDDGGILVQQYETVVVREDASGNFVVESHLVVVVQYGGHEYSYDGHDVYTVSPEEHADLVVHQHEDVVVHHKPDGSYSVSVDAHTTVDVVPDTDGHFDTSVTQDESTTDAGGHGHRDHGDGHLTTDQYEGVDDRAGGHGTITQTEHTEGHGTQTEDADGRGTGDVTQSQDGGDGVDQTQNADTRLGGHTSQTQAGGKGAHQTQNNDGRGGQGSTQTQTGGKGSHQTQNDDDRGGGGATQTQTGGKGSHQEQNADGRGGAGTSQTQVGGKSSHQGQHADDRGGGPGSQVQVGGSGSRQTQDLDQRGLPTGPAHSAPTTVAPGTASNGTAPTGTEAGPGAASGVPPVAAGGVAAGGAVATGLATTGHAAAITGSPHGGDAIDPTLVAQPVDLAAATTHDPGPDPSASAPDGLHSPPATGLDDGPLVRGPASGPDATNPAVTGPLDPTAPATPPADPGPAPGTAPFGAAGNAGGQTPFDHAPAATGAAASPEGGHTEQAGPGDTAEHAAHEPTPTVTHPLAAHTATTEPSSHETSEGHEAQGHHDDAGGGHPPTHDATDHTLAHHG